MTGAQLHEPKGVDAASSGEVYVANGSGSGNWTSISVSTFTGAVADFITPVVPSGWLELDGSVISTSTYAALASVMKIAFTGTRTNSSPIITSIASTANMKVGYYVFGTGFSAGTTILTIDSPTQITVSNSAGSSGTGALDASPWAMNTGTITLPDVTTAGRYRRSRTSATKVGDLQADQNKAHTHTGTTGNASADHTHTFSGTTGSMNQNSSHSHSVGGTGNGSFVRAGGGGSQSGGGSFGFPDGTVTINSTGTDHQHTYSGTTSGQSGTHNHTFTTSSDGSSEVRPLTLVVLTCVKT